ncbi:putative gustatory receptor 28b isoform X1 [Temnothorax longispinosus]|uniref:putative gustatory receptor 28b isoform X1 n=1 Tax=Temnothorax longispinosus TaxID=300112 RepID=UPI003A9935AC
MPSMNYKQAVMPIIWLNCIFCMGIFEIPINRPQYFLTAVYIISVLTVFFISFYKGFYILQQIFIQELMIFYVVEGVNVLVAVWAIIMFWRYKSENINKIIKRNGIADNTLEALGIKIDYQKIYRSTRCLTAIWVVTTITLIFMHTLWMYREEYWVVFYTNISTSFPFILNSVVDLTFAALVRCVGMRFQKINTLINNAVLYANESNAFKIYNRHDNTSIAFVMANYKNRKDMIMHHIQTLRHLHLEITRIGRQTNRTFCFVLLLELAVHFTIITSTTYCLHGAFFGQLRVTLDNEKIISMAMWACIYSFKIILINSLCSSVSTEAYKTGEIIQSFEGSIMDDDMKEEIQQFTQQIMLNSLHFTCTGFFSIDNSLTGKFFTTVLKYVVILIQFSTQNDM